MMKTTRKWMLCAMILAAQAHAGAQTTEIDADRIRTLEQRLAAAQQQVAQLQQTMQGLAQALAELKGSPGAGAGAGAGTDLVAHDPAPSEPAPGAGDLNPPRDEPYTERILVTDLAHDERGHQLEARPELFVQSRYHAFPVDGATSDDINANFSLSRMELRWAGRVSEKVGMGYEIQFHPAPNLAAEELINDAYVEYYANDAITFRVGQFVKPFGFDIQHSSSRRESPERGIFAGYFFPGQRDRGLMISAKLDGAAEWLRGTTVYGGVFNGNRFFNDNNRQVNYNFRIRKVMQSLPLALGASVQLGRQLLPPGISGDNRENVYGVDLQFVVGRLGVRAEYAVGNMPSTLLSLDPEFAPGFVPGSYSAAGAAFFNYNLTPNDDLYWRYDQFNNDPVTQRNVRAFNFGYLRTIGRNSRIGIDYQFKNRASFNDDRLNTKLQVSWNVLY